METNSSLEGEYMPVEQLTTKESFCEERLLKFLPNNEKKIYRDEYVQVPCSKASNKECFRRPCNCNLEIDEKSGLAVSNQPADTWQCLPPDDPIVTSNTIFLSPSPMNYTLGENVDKNVEFTQLEINFGAAFVSFFYRSRLELQVKIYIKSFFKTTETVITLNGKSVTLKPKNIQIIGDIAADEQLGRSSRMITRFAQRSMMHPLFSYSARSTGSKRQLFLGAEFEFAGLEADTIISILFNES